MTMKPKLFDIIIFFIGNGICLVNCTSTEKTVEPYCEASIQGECNCTCGVKDTENCYNGTFCDCCKWGPCQTQCFNRYTDGREEKDMCSGQGKCTCDGRGDAKQKVGEKCKVTRLRW